MSGRVSPEVHMPGWQGLTIKEILEKVDLFNITTLMDDDKKCKEGNSSKDDTMLDANPESAFLGPKLWNKPISLPMEDDESDFAVMNIEEFLNENNIDLDDGNSNSSMLSQEDQYLNDDVSGKTDDESKTGRKRPANAIKGADTNFLYAESKAARLEREREEKRQQALKIQVEFSPEDLALATIPGMAFDPRERTFSVDELRPQPIIRKRKKAYVPTGAKDEKYWEKRVKNNIAARRSREARRLKENQIALRAAYLEKENTSLKEELKKMTADNKKLMAEKAQLQQQLLALQK